MKISQVSLALWLVTAAGSAWADAMSGSITAVTLYPDTATVTRTLDISLPAGDQFMDVTGLPDAMVADSLQVTHLSGPKTLPKISSLEWLDTDAKQPLNSKQLQSLRQQKESLEAQQSQLQAELEAVKTQQLYLQTMARDGMGKNSAGNSAQQLQNGVQVLGQEMKQTGMTLASLKHQLTLVVQQLDETNRQFDKLHAQLAGERTVRIHLHSAGEPFQLTLQYRVNHASWVPLYEADLDTRNKQVDITQAALIQQHTGEDWHDAEILLSTARPSQQASAPELTSQWIDFIPDHSLLASREANTENLMIAPAMAPKPMVKRSEMADFQESASVAMSAYHVRFQVPGKNTILADRQPHRVLLMQKTYPVSLALQAIPRLDLHAYLYANVENTSDQPWLAGRWMLYRDGEPVGQTAMDTMTSHQRVQLGFGADPAIMMKWQQTQDEAGQDGLIHKQSIQKRAYQLDVTNTRNDAAELMVMDSWPVSRQSEIKVSVLDGTTPPLSPTTDQQAGIQHWMLRLPAHQQVTLKTGYQISYPEGKKLTHY